MHHKFTENQILSFPDLEDYKKKLEELGDENFEGLSYEEIENRFYDLNLIIPHISVATKPEEFNKINLFRARMISTIGSNENTSLVCAYSYPPASVVSINGRANIKNKSVFYCSNSCQAAILECNPAIGDEGYLGLWKPVTEEDLLLTTFLPQNLNSQNDFSSIAKKASAAYQNLYTNEPLGLQMIVLRNFMADKFVNEQPPYYLTSFLANEAMYKDFKTDFIVYPSSKSLNYYNNFAFHPESVDKNLRLHKVLKFKILSIDKINLSLGLGFIFVGISNSNSLNWEIPNKENMEDFEMPNATFNTV